MADNTKAGRACSASWPRVRDEVLRMHPWNSVTVRAALSEIAGVSISGASVGAGPTYPVTVTTSAVHGLVDNDRMRIENVLGMIQINGTWRVDQQSTTTFILLNNDLSVVNGSAFAAYTSGGTVTKVPHWEFDRLYVPPSDMLRLLEVDTDLEYVVENGSILAFAAPPLLIRYIKKELDDTKYDAELWSALAGREALELAEELTGISADRKAEVRSEWLAIEAAARNAESQEQSPMEFEESDWILARF